jgi:regulator of protease activity HflC (stomatin/prohibitin superfamily)
MAFFDWLFGILFFGIFAAVFIGPFVLGILSMFLKVIRQYERGLLLAFGKYAGMRGPGLNFVLPFYHRLVKMDLRIMTVDVPTQEVMTKDNVPVKINAVIYFRVVDPKKAYFNVENYVYAVSKYGQTSLRNVTGEATLDELLSERQQIAQKLRAIVDKATEPWGIDVVTLELQDIELPEGLKRTMAKQAEAERNKRATIIKAEGEMAASGNLAKAAQILHQKRGGLHLRTLQSVGSVASDPSNTVSFFLPLEILRAMEEVK